MVLHILNHTFNRNNIFPDPFGFYLTMQVSAVISIISMYVQEIKSVQARIISILHPC